VEDGFSLAHREAIGCKLHPRSTHHEVKELSLFVSLIIRHWLRANQEILNIQVPELSLPVGIMVCQTRKVPPKKSMRCFFGGGLRAGYCQQKEAEAGGMGTLKM
jgi:hypothetical protein